MDGSSSWWSGDTQGALAEPLADTIRSNPTLSLRTSNMLTLRPPPDQSRSALPRWLRRSQPPRLSRLCSRARIERTVVPRVRGSESLACDCRVHEPKQAGRESHVQLE